MMPRSQWVSAFRQRFGSQWISAFHQLSESQWVSVAVDQIRRVSLDVINPQSSIAVRTTLFVVYATAGQYAYNNLWNVTVGKDIGRADLQKHIIAVKENTMKADSNFDDSCGRILALRPKLDKILYQGDKICHLMRTAYAKDQLLQELDLQTARMRKFLHPKVSNDYEILVNKCAQRLIAFMGDTGCAPSVLSLVLLLMAGVPVAMTASSDTVQLLEVVKKEFPELSSLDFYMLAGVVAVRISGGPDIPFCPGRKDRGGSNLKNDFPSLFKDISPTIKDFVPLLGIQDSLGFDNSYFRNLLSKKVNDLTPFETKVLEDPELHFLVSKYAEDEESLFDDFRKSYLKLSDPALVNDGT